MATKATKKVKAGDDGEWDALYERMLMSLDDQGVETLEKRRTVARRRLDRMGMKEPPIDKGAVKRYLLMYAGLGMRQGECMRRSGIDHTMLLTAYDMWPESRFVKDYLAGLRHRALEMRHEDMVADALDGLARMNTDEECKLNVKSVMFTLENLDRENFGEARHGVGSGKRGGVTYNIPNLTINAIMSPEEIAERIGKAAGAAAGGEVIDAEVVKPAMLGVVA